MAGEPYRAFAARLEEIVRCTEETLGVSVPDDRMADLLPPVAHVFLHELCHEAVAGVVPWADVPEEGLDPLADEAIEVTVVVLERSVSAELGLPVHAPDEAARGLAGYPVELAPRTIRELQDVWEERYRPTRDIAGFAARILRMLRKQGPTSSPGGGVAPRDGGV